MNGKTKRSDSLFPGLRVPEPPRDLRGKALGRARQVLERGPRLDLWTRIWESRTARLAWGASVLLLSIGHLVAPVDGSRTVSAASTLARTQSEENEDLEGIAKLPRLSLDPLLVTSAFQTPGEADANPETVAPQGVSEENKS